MSAVLEMEPIVSPAKVSGAAPLEQHLLIRADWDGYQRFLAARGEDYPALKISYNRGVLELMTVSMEHERFKKLLARLVELLSFALDWEITCCGQMTINRADLDRGFEPDECYYIQNGTKMKGVRKLDLDRDPPPDLAIEIEVSRSLSNRIDIYGAIKIPEIWRYDGETLTVQLLQPDGAYQETSTSLAFPKLDLEIVRSVLSEARADSENRALRRFHSWIGKNMTSS